MESRKITIVSTKNQKKTVIESAATTLGELKADLRQNNIDYDGMTFYEGTSKVELKDDASVLPHDVPYKGTITNELVFMLTNTNKKIKSGATITTRKEAGAFFKANPAKAAKFKKTHEGKNWTNCGTADILEFINGNVPVVETSKKEPKTEKPTEMVDPQCREALQRLVGILYSEDYLQDCQLDSIEDILQGRTSTEETPSESPYSDSEIDRMFDFAR